MPLDDLLGDRQSNSAAVKFPALMQALEHLKYPLTELGVDSDAVIRHRKSPHTVFPFCRDVDPRRAIGAKLDRIADQVLDHLPEFQFVAYDNRQWMHMNPGAAFDDRGRQPFDHGGYDGAA